MRVLVVNGFAPDNADRYLADSAQAALEANGHLIDRVDLVAEGFLVAMTPAERAAYHSNDCLVTEETNRSARLVTAADGLLFTYPTLTHTVPAVVKGWCERVLVPGVAFGFDDRGRVAPGLTNIVHLGVVTATPHGRSARFRHCDLGYRTILRTLRLNCHRQCRRTVVRIRPGTDRIDAVRSVTRALGRW